MKQSDVDGMIHALWARLAGSAGRLFLFMAISLLFGCAATYVFNSPVPINKQDFDAGKCIGIAVFGDAIPGLSMDIESQINEFAGQPLKFRDIQSGVTLNQERMMIEDMEKLTGENPDMSHAFIVWEHPAQTKYETDGGEEEHTEYVRGIATKTKKDYTSYTTVFSVKCEVMLFELQRKTLKAKSIDTFRQEETKKIYHLFSRNTFLGDIEDLLDFLGLIRGGQDTPDLLHPRMTSLDKGAIRGDYFRWFLEGIGKDNSNAGMTANP